LYAKGVPWLDAQRLLEVRYGPVMHHKLRQRAAAVDEGVGRSGIEAYGLVKILDGAKVELRGVGMSAAASATVAARRPPAVNAMARNISSSPRARTNN